MGPLSDADLSHEVTKLLEYLTDEHHPNYGFGSACCSIYDTAWVSMVAKKDPHGQKTYIFENCFELLLETQAKDGGWDGSNNCLAGFAQGMCTDADDTAKSLIALNLLGIPTSPDHLINHFESSQYFLTYEDERNPSISTNAHVLLALLHTSDNSRYVSQIEKCVKYLCSVWWESDGLVQDKWNISHYYPVMLNCEGLVEYVRQYANNALPCPRGLVDTQIRLLLFQAMSRLIRKQNGDGSWGLRQSLEETAYATLTVKRLLLLPFGSQLQAKARSAVDMASLYLQEQYDYSPTRERIWFDKTLYSIATVSRSYVLSAFSAVTPDTSCNSIQLPDFFRTAGHSIDKISKFLVKLPSFKNTEEWIINSSMREGIIVIEELQKINFFSQRSLIPDKYLLCLTSCFAASNNRDCHFLSAKYILMALEITVVTYQLDSFMDNELMKFTATEVKDIEAFVHEYFNYLDTGNDPWNLTSSESNPAVYQGMSSSTQFQAEFSENNVLGAKQRIIPFIRWMLSSDVDGASDYDKMNLRIELKAALLAQLSHIKASQSLQGGCIPSSTTGATSGLDRQTYYHWLRGSASDNVLYPVILKYMICQMGQGARDVFQSAQEKYIIEDFCRHAAAEVRLWNDYGGAERDQKEGILNSFNFPELQTIPNDQETTAVRGIDSLVQLARYENRHVQLCLDEFERASQGVNRQFLISRLRMHQFVTQVWAEMYSMFKFDVKSVPL